MYLMESPLHDANFPYEKFKNFFNWTMTYRRDSDFYSPYGWISPKTWDWHYPSRDSIPWDMYMRNPLKAEISSDFSLKAVHDQIGQKSKKKVTAAWLVSNCFVYGYVNSEREKYVDELRKHLEVDIYGYCGFRKCPKNVKCYEHIADNYMFYLSFENSLCTDYVTEKFFTPLTHNVVPVVLGEANYSQHAPPNSYINARDFSSPKALADYLKYLQSNTSAYKEYFEWKKYFEVFETFHRNLSLYQDRAMCQLCEALNEETQVTKIHGDINHWWRKEGDCKIQGTFPWSHFQSKRMFNLRSIVYVLYSLLFFFAVFHCYLKAPQKFQISTYKYL